MKSRKLLGVAATAALAVGFASPAFGASHREAPLTQGDPLIDNTDVYAYTSPDKPDTVTLLANWIPFQEPAGGPNFYPWGENVEYDIHIDNNGDAVADVTYRWIFTSNYKDDNATLYNNGPVTSFNDETLLFTQTYTLQEIRGDEVIDLLTDAPVAPSHVGEASMPDYQALRDEAIVDFEAGPEGTSFAGQADDPFFLDLRVFDLLYGGDLSEVGDDTLAGYNVNTLGVQVPKTAVAADGDDAANPIIGVWSTTQRPSMRTQAADGSITFEGEPVQVSRLGNPLVNELIVPRPSRDAFNASDPVDDGQFLSTVQDPLLPKLIESVYGIPAPAAPRDDLVSVFLTGVEGVNMPENVVPSEQLRLNMSTEVTADPDPLGVIGGDNQGHPNGRRLIDDVVDIELQVLMGELVGAPNDLSDEVDANDKEFGDTFPYVALPTPGSIGGESRSGAPSGGVDSGFGGLAGTPGSGESSDGSSLPLVPLAVLTAGVAVTGFGIARTKRTKVQGA
jgi:hypothetical protein